MRKLLILHALMLSACSSDLPDGRARAANEALETGAEALPGDDDADDDRDDIAVEREADSAGGAASGDRPEPATPEPSRAAAPGERAARRGLPAGALRVVPAVIVDATGFEAPLAAATLFLPGGWTATGGVVWGQEHMCVNGYNFEWSATSADGLLRIAITPQEKWEWNNYGAPASSPGCRLAQCSGVEQYLRSLASRLSPGARAVRFARRPDLEKDFARFNQATPMPMGESRSWVEGGELRYEWNDGGHDRKASVAAVAVFSLLRTKGGVGLGVMDALTGTVFPGYAASAPADRFDPGLFEAIRRSIKVDPNWQARIAGHNTAIARTALEEGRKRSAMISRSNEEISRIRQEAWRSQQESADRRFRDFGEVIKGVETYDDANAAGGQVELSSHYNHAWRLNDGTYVLTDDSSFDPWRDLGEEGAKLEATR